MRRRQKLFKLESKFTLMYTVILIAIICSIAGVIGRFSQSILERKAQESCTQKLTMVEDRFAQILDRIENETLLLTLNQAARYESAKVKDSTAYEDYRNEDIFSSYLAEFLATQSAVEAIGYHSKDGSFFYQDNYSKSEIRAVEIPEEIQQEFLESKEKVRWYTQNSVLPSVSANRTMTCLKKSYSFLGEMLGFFSLTVSPSQIQNIYNSVFEPQEIFLITDATGQVCVSTHPGLPGTAFLWNAYDGHTDFHKIEDFLNDTYLYTSRTNRQTGMTLTVLTPERMVYRDSRFLVGVIIVTGFIASAMTLALYWYSTHRLLRPLNQIIRTVHHIADGDYGSRITTADSSDEISRLAEQINVMAENTQELLVRVQTENEEKRRFELSCLHLQMQPHFLYNTLETLCGMIEMGDKQDAIALISLISNFYRMALNKGKEIITIGQELSIITDYLGIMQKRYPGCFSVTCQVEEELKNYCIPKLTLQPLVENAVLHGLNIFLTNNEGHIAISGWQETDCICLQVADNGAGMNAETIRRLRKRICSEESESFGISSLERRLRLYDSSSHIEIDSKLKEGTMVTIYLSCLP